MFMRNVIRLHDIFGITESTMEQYFEPYGDRHGFIHKQTSISPVQKLSLNKKEHFHFDTPGLNTAVARQNKSANNSPLANRHHFINE